MWELQATELSEEKASRVSLQVGSGRWQLARRFFSLKVHSRNMGLGWDCNSRASGVHPFSHTFLCTSKWQPKLTGNSFSWNQHDALLVLRSSRIPPQVILLYDTLQISKILHFVNIYHSKELPKLKIWSSLIQWNYLDQFRLLNYIHLY